LLPSPRFLTSLIGTAHFYVVLSPHNETHTVATQYSPLLRGIITPQRDTYSGDTVQSTSTLYYHPTTRHIQWQHNTVHFYVVLSPHNETHTVATQYSPLLRGIITPQRDTYSGNTVQSTSTWSYHPTRHIQWQHNTVHFYVVLSPHNETHTVATQYSPLLRGLITPQRDTYSGDTTLEH
jgi:uncharacterized membrane protein